MGTNTWQQYFDAAAGTYEEDIFTRNTQAEMTFLLEELDLPAGSRILDMGCGTGRHAVRLAQAGYCVTGVDISEGMLSQARRAAEAAGVDVEWVQADARHFHAEEQFDVALSLCEGALCLLADGDDPLERDVQILARMSRALKPGGRLYITVLNAFRMIRQVNETGLRSGVFSLENLTRPGTMRVETPSGAQELPVWERYYTPSEMARMLDQAGIAVEYVWGGTAGAWNRRPLLLDEMEIMVVGRKS